MELMRGGLEPGERKPRQLNKFKDIYLLDLQPHIDDRGLLYEVIHDYDFLQYGNGRFGQVYMVHNPAPLTIRAFHRHSELWDYFCILHGHAKFVLVNPTGTSARTLTLSDRRPQLLVIPPGCWHGWMNTVPDTILLCIGSEVYDREAPDEERVDSEYFTESIFDGQSPWQIKAR